MDAKFTKRFESYKRSLSSLAEARNQAHDYDGEIVAKYCQTIIQDYLEKMLLYQEKVTEIAVSLKG